MKKQVLKISRIIATFLLSVISLFCGQASLFAFPVFADSANVQEAFENINVLDDLKSDKNFNLLEYPYYKGSTPEMYVINVVEFCYSFRKDKSDDYGLYLYVYNPNGQNIDTESSQNQVSIATAYNSNPVTETSKPTDYEYFKLQFCSASEGDYKNLFYKFKVIDHKGAQDGKTILERVNSNARRYDIAEIQLLKKGAQNAVGYPLSGAYAVGVNTTESYGTFYFKGYAKGFGADETADSTLSVSYAKLDTIELTLNHTYWRSQTSSLGKNHQNQVDTVYFAVPNRFFEQYGKLQRIKAEWFEYKTKDLIVTSNNDFYNTAKQYIGQTNSGKEDDWGYGLAENYGAASGMGSYTYADWTWNNTSIGVVPNDGRCSLLYYLFLTNDISSFDPYKSSTATGGIKGTELYSRMLEVSEKLGGEKIEAKDSKLISAIFEDDIDESRKINDKDRGIIQKGYSFYNFDAGLDISKWQSWDDTKPSFWDNSRNYGFWKTLFKDIPHEEGKEVQPIIDLKDRDFSGTSADISQNLMVNQNDVSAMQEYYNKNKADNHVIAFRFAVSDYYSAPLHILDYHGIDSTINGQAYRAKQSVFFDFNIIQLTFNDNGEYTVIPVVSNPIDIINDITSPTQFPDKNFDLKKLLQIILGGLLLIVLLVILMPLFPSLISLIIKIAILPFRLIAAIFKAIFHKRE